jgi:hypothetical protein
MSGFIDDLWESIWSGWTPIFMVVLFFVGLNMAGRFASLGVSPITVVFAYALGCTLVPLSLPILTMVIKNKR